MFTPLPCHSELVKESESRAPNDPIMDGCYTWPAIMDVSSVG